MRKWQSQKKKILSKLSEPSSSTFHDILWVIQAMCELAYPALNSGCHYLPKFAH